MKHTNKYNLPDEVVQWILTDDYDYEEGVYSATRLIKPVRAVVLEQRHYDEIEIDVSDLIQMRIGTAIHDSFERVKLKDCIQEERYHHDIGKFRISGKPDIIKQLKSGKSSFLKDIKTTSAWTYIYQSRKEDYRKQLSIYGFLLAQHGFTLEPEIQMIYYFTDWSRSKARQGGDYPPIPMWTQDYELMSKEDTEQYIIGRLKLFDHHFNNTKDDDLPLCTRDELWTKEDKWAIKKEGRKSAVKVHESEAEAEEHLSSLDNKHSIEHRPGKVIRCNYCTAPQVCCQYREIVEKDMLAEK